MKRILPLSALILLSSCAHYIVPRQKYTGMIATQATVEKLSQEKIISWKGASNAKPRKGARLLVIHYGFDQNPNAHQPGIQLTQVDFLKKLKTDVSKLDFFSEVAVTSMATWEPESIEDLRRIGQLHRCQYLLLLSIQYDFQSFYSSVGQFFGWIPYLNFMFPIYKIEASSRADIAILDAQSGAFMFSDSISSLKKGRTSNVFLPEHHRALSRMLHLDLVEKTTERIKGWVHAT